MSEGPLLPAGVAENFLDIDGVRLRYLEAGSGRPVLYLHGVGDVGAWRPPLGILSNDYRVIRPDHPGFIESAALPNESIPDIAAFYSRLLDVLELDDVLLIGASMGGWIATELALREPRRVTRLIVVDPAGMMVSGVPVANVFELSAEEVAERAFAPGPQRDAAVANARHTPDPDDVSFRRSERSRATAQRIASHPLMDDPGLPSRASALAMPVTLVWGEHDRLIPPEHSAAWLAAIPGSRLFVIPDAGHGPQVQQPQAFLAATGLSAAGPNPAS